MLRARRLASAVVAASLAVGGLSACRSEPTVAAYIGDSGQVSETQVQEIWDEAYDALTVQAREDAAAAEKAQRLEEEKLRLGGQDVTPAPTISPKPVQMPFTRADVVHSLVARELYGRVAEKHQVQLPADLPYEQAAAQQKLPADSEYVHLYVENVILHNLLLQSVNPSAPPTEDDMRSVYDQLAANGGVPDGQDFASWAKVQSEQNLVVVAAAAQVRDDVQEIASDLKVKVNPRYQPFELSVLQLRSETDTLDLLSTDFGDHQSVPVDDIS